MSDALQQDHPEEHKPIPEVVPAEHIAPEFPVELEPAPAEPVEAVQSQTVTEPTPTKTLPPARKPQPATKSKAPAVAQRRPATKPAERYRGVTVVSSFRAIIYTFAAAVIVATIFMWQTSPDFLSAQTRSNLSRVQATAAHLIETPTDLPTPFWFNRIGIVAGHSGIATYGPTKGNVDPGAVCSDGFTEAGVTMKVALQAVDTLRGMGFTVDLLEEFDWRLDNYQAAAFVSLHADSCANFDDGFNHSGFKVAHSDDRPSIFDSDERLLDCMRQSYGAASGLQFQPGQLTINMLHYHAFDSPDHHIAATTPGVILELGLLSYDRDLLEHQTNKLAQGVVNGILCYVKPAGHATATSASVSTTTSTQTFVPVPSATVANKP